MTTEPLYSIGTYDWEKSRYSPQRGLGMPSININRAQLRAALHRLRELGYSAHRKHDDDDPNVLVERTDGKSCFEVLRGWRR